AMSSRIDSALVPSRSSAMSTLFQRIGTVPTEAPASGPGTARRRRSRAPSSTIAAAGEATVTGAAPRRDPPARLVRARASEIAIDLQVDERRAARRECSPHGRLDLVGPFRELAVNAERGADRPEVRGVDGPVGRDEVRPRRPSEERLLTALDADPAGVVEDDRADRDAGEDGGLELLHRLEEVAVAADREDLAVGQGQLRADRRGQREAHRREA